MLQSQSDPHSSLNGTHHMGGATHLPPGSGMTDLHALLAPAS